MARYRGRDVQIEVNAIENGGQWPEILAWLDETGLSRIPLFGRPPVTREADGTLTIGHGPGSRSVPVGDWLALTAGRQLFSFEADEFPHLFELIEKDEKK